MIAHNINTFKASIKKNHPTLWKFLKLSKRGLYQLKNFWHCIELAYLNLLNRFKIIRKIKKAFIYILKGDLHKIYNYFNGKNNFSLQKEINPNNKKWCVLTPPHTIYLADLIADRLQFHGFTPTISTTFNSNEDYDYYFVLCPLHFPILPPKDKRIIYQLEQTSNLKWFSKKYIKMLKDSFALLDYSITNLHFFDKYGISYPDFYYLPVGSSEKFIKNLSPVEKEYDILFYGDYETSPHREKMLDVLKKHFNVYIETDCFGAAIQAKIMKARIVINLHYLQNNPLLEMARIQECLALGTPVVSENTNDQDEYPEIKDVVYFFKTGDIPAMLQAIKSVLQNPPTIEQFHAVIKLSANRFNFMFDRFLLGFNALPVSQIKNFHISPLNETEFFALSLPETTKRRQTLIEHLPAKTYVFDGIRKAPSWIGCGLSYLTLMNYGIKTNQNQLTIFEDDVLLPKDFNEKLRIIKDYLVLYQSNWDIFSGIIANLHPNFKIFAVDEYKGLTFITIDTMTSTVFNIYNKPFLNKMLQWNANERNAETNTIDRFIENMPDLKVIVTLPFFVEHREELDSSLWGFKNTQYKSMIRQSEHILTLKAKEFCKKHQIFAHINSPLENQ